MTGPFARWNRLIGVEVLKIWGARTFKIGLLAVAAVTAFTVWSHDATAEETAWTVVSQAFGAGLWAAEIFLLVAGTTAIAGETAQGTLKMILPHAYRRADWIVAKGAVLAGQAVLLLVVALATAVVGGMLSGGLRDVTQTIDATFGGEGRVDMLHTAAEMRGLLVSSATVALASLIATGLLGLLVSCLFDGVVPALSTGFLLFLGGKSAGAVFGASPELLGKIYASYPGEMLTRLEKLGRGFAERWDGELLGKGVTLAVMVAGGSLLVSLVVFTRRDLQS